MARVTVEDCILKVPNRFNLVMYASQRARDISSGAEETLDRDNDKNPVIALREIAGDTLSFDQLRESLILGLQKQQPSDDLEEDLEVAEALTRESIVLGATLVDGSVPLQQAANAAVAEAAIAEAAAADHSIPNSGDAGAVLEVSADTAAEADTGILLGGEGAEPEEPEGPEEPEVPEEPAEMDEPEG